VHKERASRSSGTGKATVVPLLTLVGANVLQHVRRSDEGAPQLSPGCATAEHKGAERNDTSQRLQTSVLVLYAFDVLAKCCTNAGQHGANQAPPRHETLATSPGGLQMDRQETEKQRHRQGCKWGYGFIVSMLRHSQHSNGCLVGVPLRRAATAIRCQGKQKARIRKVAFQAPSTGSKRVCLEKGKGIAAVGRAKLGFNTIAHASDQLSTVLGTCTVQSYLGNLSIVASRLSKQEGLCVHCGKHPRLLVVDVGQQSA